MCGIAGALLKNGVDSFPIHAMTNVIKHRGPDDEGYLLLDPVEGSFESRAGKDTHASLHFPSIDLPWPQATRLVFGHRRLSILDLSPAGHQPMADFKKEFWITYNGEIYNYKELRRELENLGVRFSSQTDTEVILEAYKMWGTACLHRFNGMWAFAIWDSRKKILFCSRDRFGVKPFYYTQIGSDFFFASEIKALLASGKIAKQASEEAIFDFLVLSLPTREPQTFFRHIQSLGPGHSLTVGLNGHIDIQKWYSFPENIGQNLYEKKSSKEFYELLNNAVRLRLQSDVRVGSCLSGGLDSSSIVALAAKQMKTPLETFSACFEDESCDERKFIQPVLDQTKAHSHFVFPQGLGFWEEWAELTAAQEEPFGSTSLYAHWCVMREASRQKVPVLLNGQGGDELLAGYPRYRINHALGRIAQGDLRAFSYFFKDPRFLGFFAFQLLPPSLFVQRTAVSMPFLKRDFLKKHHDRHADYFRARVPCQKNLSQSLKSDFFNYILPSLLRYEDKNSMHFSVEVRLPFMDYRLVEWVFGLEDGAKIHGELNKRILRESMEGTLPENVRLRQDKMGWATPMQHWLAAGDTVQKQFFGKGTAPAVASWIDLKRFKKRIHAGASWDGVLWRVLNLEMWSRTVLTSIQNPQFHLSY